MVTLGFGRFSLHVFTLGDWRVDEGVAFVRVGRPGDQPTRVNDGFYPSRDLGLLWLRWVGGHLACSGIVTEDGPAPEELDALLERVDEAVLHTDHQVDYRVDVVRVSLSLAESGEESLRW